MAQRTQVTFIDDLDGQSEAAGTVSFSLDGTDYETDLSDEHAAVLRDALSKYVGAARKVPRSSSGRSRTATGGTPRSGNEPSPEKVRTWARENGHKVNDRGRIAGSVIAAFQGAH